MAREQQQPKLRDPTIRLGHQIQAYLTVHPDFPLDEAQRLLGIFESSHPTPGTRSSSRWYPPSWDNDDHKPKNAFSEFAEVQNPYYP